MNGQLTLDGGTEYADHRTNDTDTARLAARRDRSTLRDDVRRVLLLHPCGLTDHELTEVLGIDPARKPSVGKRRQELGAVDTGHRRATPLGSLAIVWTLR